MPAITSEAIAVIKEGSYRGGSPSFGSTDFIEAREITPGFTENLRTIERGLPGTLGRRQTLKAGRTPNLQFVIDLYGAGLGVLPRWARIFEACGVAVTVNASTSVVLAPASENHASVALQWYEATQNNFILHTLVGCRGNISINFGVTATATVTLTGHPDIAKAHAANLPAFSYDGITPPVWQGAGSMQFGGTDIQLGEATMELGNNVAIPPDVNQTNGYAAVIINSRAPTLAIEPENPEIATLDWLGLLDGSATTNGQLIQVGQTAGNIVRLSAPKANVLDAGSGDRESIRTKSVTLELASDTGDDEWELLLV